MKHLLAIVLVAALGVVKAASAAPIPALQIDRFSPA